MAHIRVQSTDDTMTEHGLVSLLKAVIGVLAVIIVFTLISGVLQSQRYASEVITRQERINAMVKAGADPIQTACTVYGVQHSMDCTIRGLHKSQHCRTQSFRNPPNEKSPPTPVGPPITHDLDKVEYETRNATTRRLR